MYIFFIILVMAWGALWSVIIAVRYKEEIISNWREPVLKVPVLIFESDDWGAGPLSQAQSLDRIISILKQYSDCSGHFPVMTLGVVLSIADAEKMRITDYKNYDSITLSHPAFLELIGVMKSGLSLGIFDLQLHGMSHYWPDNLLREIQTSEEIHHWIEKERFPLTENLPSVLQSRWINAEKLPTIALQQNEIDEAVVEEVSQFKSIFGFKPRVAVPPTFIWNKKVEMSWKQQGIDFLVTPGQSFDHRDEHGKPSGDGKKIVNGQLSESGLVYIKRDNYFEPSLGHSAEMAVDALEVNTQLCQPTLLEIHRMNFIQNEKITEKSLAELERVVSVALKKYPDLKFLSTNELGQIYSSNNPEFIEQSCSTRVLVWMQRLWMNNTIRKWMYFSGLFVPFFCLAIYRKKT